MINWTINLALAFLFLISLCESKAAHIFKFNWSTNWNVCYFYPGNSNCRVERGVAGTAQEILIGNDRQASWSQYIKKDGLTWALQIDIKPNGTDSYELCLDAYALNRGLASAKMCLFPARISDLTMPFSFTGERLATESGRNYTRTLAPELKIIPNTPLPTP